MRKSFRDKVQDALARKHAIVISRSGKTTRTAKVDVITAEVAFKHFWGLNFRKAISWSTWKNDLMGDVDYYTGVLYIAGYKFISEGSSKDIVIERLAQSFCNTVPLFTASGAEMERVTDNG